MGLFGKIFNQKKIDGKSRRDWWYEGVDAFNMHNPQMYEKAIKCFDKALEIDPNDSDSWALKGTSLDLLNRSQEAIKCFDKALEINPRDAEVWRDRGLAFEEKLGNLEEAIKCYDKALAINKNDELSKSQRDKAILLLDKQKEVSIENNRYISSNVKRAVWRRDQGKCICCGNNEKLEYDHIIPVSKGGSNTERNIQLLCEKCNRSKGGKII